jgi:hypothetical protein
MRLDILLDNYAIYIKFNVNGFQLIGCPEIGTNDNQYGLC